MTHANERLLKRAPITEAVIDLRVVLRSEFSVYAPALRDAFRNVFGPPEEQPGTDGALIFPATPTTEAVQVSESGFAFSKLQPYTSWGDVRDSARRFWEIYRQVADVESIRRVGLRFINQFHLRHDQHLAHYLTVPPQVPETVPTHQVIETLSRFKIEDENLGLSALVFYVCRKNEAGMTVIIDTDAAKSGIFDSDQVWTSLEQLRAMKNRIFFGSITETAAKEFDG